MKTTSARQAETSRLHIYRAPSQPAHCFVVHFGGPLRHWFRRPKRSLVRCRKCEQPRWAQNCTVQVYYDDIRFFCRPGKGCKGGRA
jgi:hypothetical protein